MKKLQLLILFFLVLIALPNIATSQQLARNYNLRQKSAFIENKGQVADQNGVVQQDVKYLYSAPGLKLVLKKNSFSYEVFTLEKKKETSFSEATGSLSSHFHDKFKEPEEVTVHTHRIDVSFVGANPNPEIIAEERSSDNNNYYLAHTSEEGVTNVFSYSKLTYKNLYPNIDIVFYAKEEGKLKYDIVVHPGGKLENVKMKYDGADGLALSEEKLKIKTSHGEIEESIPYSFIKGNNQTVQIKHVLKNNVINFTGNYDGTRTLIIDPIIEWATYYGGGSFDTGYDIEKDSLGNIYLIGHTGSTTNIATTGTHQSTVSAGVGSSFVVKFTSGGVRQWGTYYGGSGGNSGWGITLDKNRNIYIVGNTSSDTASIATSGAHQVTFGGWSDAFLVKFNNNGIRQWGTYYGGSGDDYGYDIATDGDNVYITGPTSSSTTTAIATTGAHQVTYGGGRDAFVAKFNSNGVRQWGTYYGGSGEELGYGISADTTGNVYITAKTASTSGIATIGAHQSTNGGYMDTYIAKFNTSGVRQWGTYYGGSGNDEAYAIYADNKGFIYVAGNTGSSSGIATTGTHQTILGSSTNLDAYIAKFNSNGVRQWGTYYGGSNQEVVRAISVDNLGNIYITGYTQSTTGISSTCVYQSSFSGVWDAFVAKFTSSGKRQWGTYYGGLGLEDARGILADNISNVYVTGTTRSTTGIATSGSHQSTYGGGTDDAFIAKFTDQIAFLDGVQTTCSGTVYSYISNKGNGFTYMWSIIGGTIVSGQGTEKIDVLWGNAGTGSVKVVVTYYSVCKDSASQSITIQASPLAIVGTNTTICSGSSVNLGATSVTGNTYSWTSKPAGFTSILANPQVYPTLTTTYFLTEKNTLTGCSKTDSVIINVNPPISNNVISSSQIICSGVVPSSITGSTPTGGGGNYIYQWENSLDSINWNPIINANSINYSPASLFQTTYFRRTVSTATCAGSLASISGIIKVTVNPLPKANFTATQVCIGGTTSFQDSSKLASAYLWNFGDGDSTTSVNPAHTYKTAGVFQVKLIVTSLNGCKDTITKAVSVDPLPVADFSAGNICLSDSVNFNNTSTTATTYLWNFGDGNTSALENPSHKYSTAGTYNVKLKVWNGAGCIDSVSKTIIIFPLPAAKLSVTKDSTTKRAYSFSSKTITSQYFWSFGDGTTDSGKTVKHTYQKDSTYEISLVVKDTNGCTAVTDTTINVETVGISEFNAPVFDIKFYPNPFSGITTLTYEIIQKQQVEINLYDLSGKEITVLQTGIQVAGKYQYEIIAAKYQIKAGVYILKVMTGNQIISRQLIKLKE